MDLKNKLRTEAARLGFSLFGVTGAAPPGSLPVYLRWLDSGYHGEMAYLAVERAVERRANPALILPEVKSIILLGLRYPKSNPVKLTPSVRLTGQVAAYAWGRDYHDIIPPRLEQLTAFMQHETGSAAVSRAYTDTGPILERDLASRAGLGWIGRNSCLIDPKTGSYYLLAELFTSLELEPDAPFRTDHCGTCRRCIDACPTQCILPNRIIDARRCISYLTIENKGSIPVGLRPAVGSWVFGCDVCQQVCPWNLRFADDTYDPELQPDADVASPDLLRDLTLTPQEFNRRFKMSPIRRAKRRGYLRNIAVALGNSTSYEAVAPLIHALDNEPEPLVRGHAAWALGQLGGGQAKSALENTLLSEPDPGVIDEIKAALDRFTDES